MKIPSDIFLYLSFVRRHTKFALKIFEIDFVIEIWPLPRAQGGGSKKCAVARPIHVSNSHTIVRGDRDSRANSMLIYGDLYQIKL